MESKDWNGEGLPPVGMACEGYVQDSAGVWRWLEVEVLKYNSISHDECAVHVLRHSILRWCDQFRPIRTEEDVAIEAMEMICMGKGPGLVDTISKRHARALYRAGYRKQ